MNDPFQLDLFGPTLADAKRRLFEGLRYGEIRICPCCEGKVAIYRRPMHYRWAHYLILMWHLGHKEKAWVHTADIERIARSGHPEMGQLELYGLVERKSGEKEDGNPRIGFWRLTQLGIDFIFRRIKVPQAVVTLHGKLRHFDGDNIGVEEALGKKFDYAELMGWSGDSRQ